MKDAGRRAKTIYRRSDAFDDAHDRSGADVCLSDRQDQLDRLETEDVAGVVLRIRHLLRALPANVADDDEPGVRRYRFVGGQRSSRMGRRDSQLRLVDRNRPRGNASFRTPAPAAPTLAHAT